MWSIRSGVERRGAPDDPVDLVSLREEQLREVAPVLPRDPGDERALHRSSARNALTTAAKEKGPGVGPGRFKLPGSVLLSHTVYPCSTIGSEGLNGRVRNGNGWSPLDMATGNSISYSDRIGRSRPRVFAISRFKNFMAKPHGRLVLVSFAPRSASTPGLSTWSSPTVLQGACAPGKSNLGVGFALICLQRLSYRTPLPGVCRWRDNRCTGGSSNPVLSY